MQEKLVALDGCPQVALQLEPIVRLRAHVSIEEDPGGFPSGLSLVHREVRSTEKVTGRSYPALAGRNPDTGSMNGDVAVQLDRFG